MFDTDSGVTPAAATSSVPSSITSPKPRVAIVTGYFKEDRRLLERCLASVRAQTMAVDHIVVADGFPQDWLDEAGVRHIRLDRSHGDYGGTPRGVGSLLAIAEDYDAIGFLDADNWLEPDHVELGVATSGAGAARADYVIAQRHMRRPDETILPVRDEPLDQHVDTNCFLFFAGAFHALQMFALIPRQLSAIGDRLFYANLKGQPLERAVIAKKTVNYHCLWASIYASAGEAPPTDAKPNIDQTPINAWLGGLSDLQRTHVGRRTGLVLANPAAPATKPSAPTPPRVTEEPGLRSFDVFDTLIARRCLDPWRVFEEVGALAGIDDFVTKRRAAESLVSHDDYSLDTIYDQLAAICDLSPARRDEVKALELARELANVVPINENLAQVRDGDLLISDMYLDAAQIRALLERAGLRRQVSLHVEAHGKSSGRIWPLLAAQVRITRHLGDNPHSDVAMPQRFAIRSQLTRATDLNVVEQTLMTSGLRDLALLSREARLATWHDDPRIRALQLLQVNVNFPMLALASVFLARRASALGKTAISFCSRDCNLWLPLFDAMQTRMNAGLASHYFLTSRVARTRGSEAYLDYARQHVRRETLVVDICGTGWSMAQLAERLGESACDLFLVDYLPPFDIYERAKKTPKTCVIHPLFAEQRKGNNMVLEAANLADHGMFVDMRRVSGTFVPVFEAPPPASEETLAIAAQRDAFLKAVELMPSYRLDDAIALDDPSIQVLCGALYQYLSRQTEAYQILARGFLEENNAVLHQLVG